MVVCLVVVMRHVNAAIDARDAGLTWVWAKSPRTLQSYLVRATWTPDGGLHSFQLDDSLVHEFNGCFPPRADGENEPAITCTDQLGLTWNLTTD